MSDKNESVVVKPRYLETPRGRIPTYDFALGILKAVKVLDDVMAEFEEKVSKLEKSGAPGLDELKSRLERLEKILENLEKRLEPDLEDINDKLSTLMDAFDKLVERVQKLEESLSKG